jgi:hypothetical protein
LRRRKTKKLFLRISLSRSRFFPSQPLVVILHANGLRRRTSSSTAAPAGAPGRVHAGILLGERVREGEEEGEKREEVEAMIAVDSAVRWKQRFYLRCISFSLFFSFYVSRIASALRTQKKEAEREGERKEEEKEKTENIDSSLAHFELFRFRCDPRPPLNKKKTFTTDRPRQVLRQVRHEALDHALLGRADLPFSVLRSLLRRDAIGAQVRARAVGAELKGGGEGERELFSLFFSEPLCSSGPFVPSALLGHLSIL